MLQTGLQPQARELCLLIIEMPLQLIMQSGETPSGSGNKPWPGMWEHSSTDSVFLAELQWF